MNFKPLAFQLRPKTIDEVIGQSHLLGENGIIRKLLEENNMFSLILYGPPGTGKTTIAELIAKKYELNHHKFNASVDTKKILVDSINQSLHYGSTILIVDEIHRMKRDIQDYLLPHIESGNIILIGLTTVNPYHSVNRAIRSRCHILKLEPLSLENIKEAMIRALKHSNKQESFLSNDVYDYIAHMANGEIRTAINMVELLIIAYKDNEKITLKDAEKIVLKPSIGVDKNGNDYYDILSGLQKSIRGSDVNAALHYLARLIISEDLPSITRRLTVIAYEDIGLANPQIGPRVVAACQAAERVGFPEARIPLSVIVVDMALSPKSNSAYSALDNATKDIMDGNSGEIPLHLKNVPSYSLKESQPYLYPHDYENALVYQQYLPDSIKDKTYYTPKDTGKYERALAQRYDQINQFIIKHKKGK